MAMELKVLTPEEQWIAQGIQWNNEELKTAIATKMEDYKGLQYTEETIKEAKKDKANLNKLRTALEDERKRVKKQCMAPYEVFEKQVKEIVALIDEPIALIDKQIKEVDEQKKAEKKEKIMHIYEDNIGNLKELIPFEKLFKPEYLNASKSIKSITEELTGIVAKINADLKVIDELDTKYEMQVKDMYIRTFDLSMALHENARLIETEKRLAERKAQEEKERAEREEREKAEKAVAQAVKESDPEPKADVPVVETVTEPVVEQTEKTYTIDFRVVATADQLNKLKAFLHNNNIKYGRPVPEN